MSERIGLRFPESIDKISVPAGDGDYRLSIGQFEAWETMEDPCGKLREKIECYLTAIRNGFLLDRYPDLKGRNGRITLMTLDPLPTEIDEYFTRLIMAARSHGVALDHWIIDSV